MTTNHLPIIIVTVDTITHDAGNNYECLETACICHDEVEDHRADVPPSEAELDAQERESDALWVNGDEEDEEPITSGPRRIDWSKMFA
jgi:hypothetical protein